jgi:lysophospholipase L1-like esterase
LLRNEGIAYDPDLVVYAFCLNDVVGWFWRHIPLGKPRPFSYELLEASGWLRLGRGLSYDARRRSVLRSFDPEKYGMGPLLSDADTPGINEAWSVMLDHVGQMVQFTRDHGRRAAFLVFPAPGLLQPDARGGPKPQRRLYEFADANGVPYLDLFESFLRYCETPGHSPSDLFFDGWHMAPRGHELTAEVFVDFLMRSDVLGPERQR